MGADRLVGEHTSGVVTSFASLDCSENLAMPLRLAIAENTDSNAATSCRESDAVGCPAPLGGA